MSFNIGGIKVDFMKPTFNKIMRDPLIRDPNKREKLIEGFQKYMREPSIRPPIGSRDLEKLKMLGQIPLGKSVFN